MPKEILQMKVTSQVAALRYAAYLGECNLIMWAFFFFFKQWFSLAGSRSVCQRDQKGKEESTWERVAHLRWRRACGLRICPSQQPARKQGPQSYSQKEVHSADNMAESGSGFFPEPPQRNTQGLTPWFQPCAVCYLFRIWYSLPDRLAEFPNLQLVNSVVSRC